MKGCCGLVSVRPILSSEDDQKQAGLARYISTTYIGDLYQIIADIFEFEKKLKISDIFDIFKTGYFLYFSTLLNYWV